MQNGWCDRHVTFPALWATHPAHHAPRRVFSSLCAMANSPSSPSLELIVHHLAAVVLDMKDTSTTSTRQSRHAHVYPKKRPSPHGISKSNKTPLLPVNRLAKVSPRAAKAALLQQQQRQKASQLLSTRRESVYLEEEYRDEIRRYMHDMEVSHARPSFFIPAVSCFVLASKTPCHRRSQWINSPKFAGTCAPVLSTFLLRSTSPSGFDPRRFI